MPTLNSSYVKSLLSVYWTVTVVLCCTGVPFTPTQRTVYVSVAGVDEPVVTHCEPPPPVPMTFPSPSVTWQGCASDVPLDDQATLTEDPRFRGLGKALIEAVGGGGGGGLGACVWFVPPVF